MLLEEGEPSTRTELLRLLVLLVSAGGLAAEGPESEASSREAGKALIRPLLAIYQASLSCQDQVWLSVAPGVQGARGGGMVSLACRAVTFAAIVLAHCVLRLRVS